MLTAPVRRLARRSPAISPASFVACLRKLTTSARQVQPSSAGTSRWPLGVVEIGRDSNHCVSNTLTHESLQGNLNTMKLSAVQENCNDASAVCFILVRILSRTKAGVWASMQPWCKCCRSACWKSPLDERSLRLTDTPPDNWTKDPHMRIVLACPSQPPLQVFGMP